MNANLQDDILPEGLVALERFKITRKARRMNWSQDGASIAITTDTGSSGEVALFSRETQKIESIFDCEGMTTAAHVLPRTGEMVYGNQNGQIFVCKARHLGITEKRTFPIHKDAITQVRWSPNGDFFAASSHDQTVSIVPRSSDARGIRRIQSTHERHNSLVWSPSGRELAICGSYYGAKLVSVETGNEIWQTDRGFNVNFLDLAWSPRGEIAMAVSDGTIWIVDSSTGVKITELEGHKDAVVSVAYSFDGRLLFSLGLDNKLRVWDASTFIVAAELTSLIHDHKYFPTLGCHPKEPILVAPSTKPTELCLLQFNTDVLERKAPAEAGRTRTRVKVALVGQSEVGKTQIANRLRGLNYGPGETTHGISITCIPATVLDPSLDAKEWSDREILLWDLGGQRDYQLIHQLFLHNTTLALLLCDPTRRDVAYHDVETWVNKLHQQARGGAVSKILVGAKVDSDIGLIVENELTSLKSKLGIDESIHTSAKTGMGIAELGSLIVNSIDWGRFERVVRPGLFQAIRDKLEELRSSGEIAITVPALIELLRSSSAVEIQDSSGRVDFGAFNIVVTQLALQGVIAETRLTDGTQVLVLQISEIERYAGSLLVLASNNPDGIPAIDELSILGASTLPGLSKKDRLGREQERIVIEAVIQLLLQNGICLRHEGMLVFPSKVTATSDDSVPEGFVELFQHIDFLGAIENVYATLITSLSNSRHFGRLRIRPGRVEFVGRGSGICAIRCVGAGPGRATLRAYASTETSADDRMLFYSYIQEHLGRMGIELNERLEIRCSCGGILEDEVIRKRLAREMRDIICPMCEARHDLTDLRQHGANVNAKLEASRIRAAAEDELIEIGKKTGRMLEARERRLSSHYLYVLHLSDLHISESTDVASLLTPLLLDLAEQGCNQIDYLVLTGDITNRASRPEFERAFEFISSLLDAHSISAARTILVPGNHDVDWDTKVYEWQPKRSVTNSDLRPGYFREEGSGYLLQSRDIYNDRFKNYADFYETLRLAPFQLDPNLQFSVDTFGDDGVQFLSLNSSARIDEFFPERSGLLESAVANAIQEAHRQAPRGQRLMRIGVFHHPAAGDERMKDDGFLSLLQRAGVGVCLHGHVHEERADLFSYLDPRKIHLVGAGTFNAAAAHRPESTPRLYNLLRVAPESRRIRVHTRFARKQSGAWDEWCVWPNEQSAAKQGWYEFELAAPIGLSRDTERDDDRARRVLGTGPRNTG